jgi:hypothetical protein
VSRSIHEVTCERHRFTYALRRGKTLERPFNSPEDSFHPRIGDGYNAICVEEAEAFQHRGEQDESCAIQTIPCRLRRQGGVDAEPRTLQDTAAAGHSLPVQQLRKRIAKHGWPGRRQQSDAPSNIASTGHQHEIGWAQGIIDVELEIAGDEGETSLPTDRDSCRIGVVRAR